MPSELQQIKVRVSGKAYSQIAEDHRRTFVTGALDMLCYAYCYVEPRLEPRVNAIIHYANQSEADAIRKRFDDYLNANSDRQKYGAASSLFSALNSWCKFDSIGKRWRPRSSTLAAYYAALLVYTYLVVRLVGRSILALGAGKLLTGLAVAVVIFSGLWLLVKGYRVFLVGRRIPARLMPVLFYEVKSPNTTAPHDPAMTTKPMSRIDGQKFLELTEGHRTTYVVGALDMLCFLFLYFAPTYKAWVEALITDTGKYVSGALARKFDEYMNADGDALHRGAASSLVQALEAWSRFDEQPASANALAPAAPIV